jgi:hypothetical protein
MASVFPFAQTINVAEGLGVEFGLTTTNRRLIYGTVAPMHLLKCRQSLEKQPQDLELPPLQKALACQLCGHPRHWQQGRQG